jgi:hypothetical protein
MPWEQIEEEYAKNFKSNEGQVAKPSRLAFGAMYIQISEGFTDIKTKEHIQENPHMQYFCGYESYRVDQPFDASLMVHFRKRIPADMVMNLIETEFKEDAMKGKDAPEHEIETAGKAAEEVDCTDGADMSNNRGTLILDATCCPQDIHYPTDIGLLNQARELCEDIIDRLYQCVIDKYEYKPRTYREVARKDYMAYVKNKKPSAKKIRKHLRKQLQYVSRDIRIIEDLISKGAPLSVLPSQLYKKLMVINEVYRQQKEMFDNKEHRCDGRIVSISQPHVRPVVRGKEHEPTEFGSKVAIGLVGGYAFITDISWENTSEASLLPQAVEQYKEIFGVYPKTVIGDRVYPNRSNRDWCKEREIRLSGPALGRKNEEIKREEAKQQHKDGCERNAVEGMFGVTKRKFNLGNIMAKLPGTSKTVVALGFFVANMERKLRLLFSPDKFSFVFYDFKLLRLGIATI